MKNSSLKQLDMILYIVPAAVKQLVEKLRQKYMQNSPEGMTSDTVKTSTLYPSETVKLFIKYIASLAYNLSFVHIIKHIFFSFIYRPLINIFSSVILIFTL